jgi:hypothetical protein
VTFTPAAVPLGRHGGACGFAVGCRVSGQGRGGGVIAAGVV